MRRSSRIQVLMGLIMASGLSGCSQGMNEGITASGTVEATEADLGFQLAGRVESILVREGDSVEAGAEVAFLDRAELEARRRAAEAQREGAEALLNEMLSGFRQEEVSEGRAALRQAEERRDDALRDQERAQRLFDGGSVSREVLDKAQTAFRVAEAGVDQAQQRLQILEEGVRPERLVGQRAVVAQAEAAVAQVDAALRNSVVVVPFSGIVTVRHREPGETVSPGIPVITLLDPEDRWVRIYVREDRIGAVSLGQAAEISSDTYPDRSYGGEVVFISNEAEFTPRNVQTTEERVKLVYAVKVRITGDASHDLKAGIPADVVLSDPGPSGA